MFRCVFNILLASVLQGCMISQITWFGVFSGIGLDTVAWFWMMTEQDLADVVQIAVEDLNPDHPGTVKQAAPILEREMKHAFPEVENKITCTGAEVSYLF